MIVGATVGATFGVIALGLVGFFFWRHRRDAQGPKPLDLSGEYQYKAENQSEQFGAITPFSAPSTQGEQQIVFHGRLFVSSAVLNTDS